MTADTREAIVALLRDPKVAPSLRPDQAASVAAELTVLLALVLARTQFTAIPPERDPDTAAPEQLLTPEETAERLGVSIRWLYRNADSLGCAKRLSRKTLRFSPRGLERYLARRGS